MTRYSDLISHLQVHIEKHGDQPLTIGGGHSYTAYYMYAEMRKQAQGLNKAVHRKNREIERLRKKIVAMQAEIC